jgi:hypothetical protein
VAFVIIISQAKAFKVKSFNANSLIFLLEAPQNLSFRLKFVWTCVLLRKVGGKYFTTLGASLAHFLFQRMPETLIESNSPAFSKQNPRLAAEN